MYSIEEVRASMAALYLRGAERPFGVAASRWPAVLAALRRGPSSSPSEALRVTGLWHEALCLEGAVGPREAFLCAVDDVYPAGWRRLGRGAPPVLWSEGPPLCGPWVGIVGSRSPSAAGARWATEGARAAVRAGYGVVSGGAVGCDQLAALQTFRSQGRLLEVLPCGLRWPGARTGFPDAWRLSAAAPEEAFSRGLAMERNALIYAAGVATLVCHVRFREGGSWHAATSALRRRLGPVLVAVGTGDEHGERALVALGARRLLAPDGLPEALESVPSWGAQESLTFG